MLMREGSGKACCVLALVIRGQGHKLHMHSQYTTQLSCFVTVLTTVILKVRYK